MVHTFVHKFEDEPRLGDFSIDLDPPTGAKIRFEIENGGEIWLSANRAGWLHLAAICAEMAMHTGFEPGYHFHRSYDWEDRPADSLEVSFEMAAD